MNRNTASLKNEGLIKDDEEFSESYQLMAGDIGLASVQDYFHDPIYDQFSMHDPAVFQAYREAVSSTSLRHQIAKTTDKIGSPLLESDDASKIGDGRKFSCDECNKRFARQNDLKRHLLIHSNSRPFKCEYEGCDKAFRQRSALTIHHRYKAC